MLSMLLIPLVLTSGLLAGFFFAYWCSVMVGLHNVPDRAFIESFQAINRVLPNGRFALPFFTPVVLAPVCTWLAFTDGDRDAGWWCLAASVLQAITFLITGLRNVPLNNELEVAGMPASEHDARRVRASFFEPWTRWNDVRFATSTLAFSASIGALVA
jgi:uncharacterized membrane protein